MIASLVGAGLSAVGSIFGGIKASEAMREVKDNIEERKRKNESWYNHRYNEDATQRADAQRILNMTEESIKNRNRQASGTVAVAGGTAESVAASKAANNRALAEAASQIAASGADRRDKIEASYRQKDSDLDDSLNKMEVNRASAIASAVKGVAQAGAGLMKGDFSRSKRSGAQQEADEYYDY